MTARTRRRAPLHSHRPVCPEPYCRKLWAPDKQTARALANEISQERHSWPALRFYEHAGGWHFTRDVTGRTKNHGR